MDVNEILQKRLDIFEKEAINRIEEATKGAKGAMGRFKNSVKAFREELERISTLKLVGSTIELFEESDGNMIMLKFDSIRYEQEHGKTFKIGLQELLEYLIETNRNLLYPRQLETNKNYDVLIIPLKRKTLRKTP